MLQRAMSTNTGGGLYCELYWGTNLSDAWTYGPEHTHVHAAPDEKVPLPLYGFTLPEEPFLLAERTGQGWRIHLPPAARLERKVRGDHFASVPESELHKQNGHRAVDLTEGTTLRLMEGQLTLVVQGSVVKERVGRLQAKDFGWLLVVSALFLSLPVGFLIAGPTPERQNEANARALKLAAEKEAARRKELGVDTPMRPLTDTERAQQSDGGTGINVPGFFRVR
ncbi:hypothetical protein ACLESO_57215 [Pyxidicoccus sp. 3LG]